jgi:hypothetical protein
MVKKLLYTAIALPFLSLGASFLLAPIAEAYPSCDALTDLQGSVSQNQASVTNYSTNPHCVYEATLAVYDSPKEPDTYGWIEAQTLIGSKTVKVAAGETVSITVEGDGPSCVRQSDLIRGSEVFTPPTYRMAMATDVYRTGNCSGPTPTCTLTPTPTPTVTETPTPTPTGTLTPTPTNTPGPTATPTPAPAVAAASTKLASTGNMVFVYGVILVGILSLIAGMVLRKFSK